MGPLLLDTATGQRHRLRPDRTLVGTADHCEVQLPPGFPHVAGVIAPDPAGSWVWHVLAGGSDSGTDRRLALGDRVALKPGSRVDCGERAYVFAPGAPHDSLPVPPARPGGRAVSCHVTIARPDGDRQSFYLDRDLVVGRLPECHVVMDARGVSRMHALFAVHPGGVVVHNLSRSVIGRNRVAVGHSAALEHGDVLQLGSLYVDVEIEALSAPRAAAAATPATPLDMPTVQDDGDEGRTDTPSPDAEDGAREAVARGARRLEAFLRRYEAGSVKPGGRGWFGESAAVAKAREASNRRDLAAAFSALDQAVRANPEGRDLLQALYRFYREHGLTRYCYRPLRHLETLDRAAGRPADATLLTELARACALLGPEDLRMFEFALDYWRKVEARTGRDHRREQLEVMALQTMHLGGYAAGRSPGAD